jgi:hypothetical protein
MSKLPLEQAQLVPNLALAKCGFSIQSESLSKNEPFMRLRCLIASALLARCGSKRDAQRLSLARRGATSVRSRRDCWLSLLGRKTTAREEEMILRPRQQLRQLSGY